MASKEKDTTSKPDTRTEIKTVDDCCYDKEAKQFEYGTVKKTYEYPKNEQGTEGKAKLIKTERDTIQFVLQAERQKSALTQKEQLVITAYYVTTGKQEKCGTITAVPSTLLEDILKLRDYGVMIPRSAYGTIAKAIEKNYLDLKPKEKPFDNDVSTDRIEKIFALCCTYIAEEQVERTPIKNRNYYNIETKDFDDLIANSEYRHLDIPTIKKQLLDKKLIFANAGRYDRNYEKKKYISFDGEAVDKEIGKGVEK